MRIDWSSSDNQLILNPRLPAETRLLFQKAWREAVEPRFKGQIGVATSGSSGESHGKLIVLSKSAVLTNARAVNRHLEVTAYDMWMKSLPDFHVGGLGIFARASLNGAKVFESRLERWTPKDFFDELLESKATLLALVPTQLFDLVSLGLSAPGFVRAVVIGGGRLEESLHARALTLGWPVLVSYGCTECCSQVATARAPHDPRLVPLTHVELRIDDDGRLAIKSAALLTGQIVFQNSQGVFTDPKVNGWFRTEDRAEITADGCLAIQGRTSDFVKVGGEGVIMSRLEERLEKMRASDTLSYTFDFAVLAAQDERLGAKIVLLTSASESVAGKLMEQFNEGVLPFERIREIHCVSEIPRSALGKILRGRALALVGLKPAADVSRDT